MPRLRERELDHRMNLWLTNQKDQRLKEDEDIRKQYIESFEEQGEETSDQD